MALSVRLRRQVKVVLRPLTLLLLRCLRLPIDEMLPRIEQLEQQASAVRPPPPQATVDAVQAVRGTVINLTRAWMRQQHDLANLSAAMVCAWWARAPGL